jgi:hypothetical protein
MSDPRNAAHAKKVAQQKKHEGHEHAAAGHPAEKPEADPAKHDTTADPSAAADDDAAGASAAPTQSPAAAPPAALAGSLIVLAKLKELEFHSRAHLERLAELGLTVEDELKQTAIVAPLGEVYSAQNALQTKLTALIEQYQAECDSMQPAGA